MNDKDFTKIFEDTNALMYGHFILSSGMRSDTYFQCAKVLQHPKYLMMFGEILCNYFKSFGVEKVVSPAMGGIVLGTEVGRQLGVKTIFCERSEGNMKLRRGFSVKKGEKILIIEDVLSTGGSLKEVINLINNHGADIVGIPLEELREEKWTITDENFGKGNTLYTYAFVIMEKYKSNGYAKMLKRVYISWAKKREDIKYITGHVREGIANRFDNNIEIVNHIKDWQGTGKPFEYYRRSLENELKEPSVYSPPVEITI